MMHPTATPAAEEVSRLRDSLNSNLMDFAYADGSWSGGETQRRISCMYIQCKKKLHLRSPTIWKFMPLS